MLDLLLQREQTSPSAPDAPSAPDEHGSSKWRLLHVYLVFDSATCPGSSDFKSSNSNSALAGLTDVVIRCIFIRRSSMDLWIYVPIVVLPYRGSLVWIFFGPDISGISDCKMQMLAKTTMNECTPRTLERRCRRASTGLPLSCLSIYIVPPVNAAGPARPVLPTTKTSENASGLKKPRRLVAPSLSDHCLPCFGCPCSGDYSCLVL